MGAIVLLDLHEPHLGDIKQVVRGHPNLFLFHNALLEEVGLVPIDERQGISLAIILIIVCSPVRFRLLEEEMWLAGGRLCSRQWMAWELFSALAVRVLTVAVRSFN